ncbi:MAG: PDZ domain-containing protein [Acidobacteriota bacterium]
MKKTALLMAVATGAALAGGAHADESSSEVRVRVVEKRPCPTVQWEGDDQLSMAVEKRGFLGVEITSLTPDLRRHFGVDEEEGVMIGKVVDDSAAARAGLAVGDIITRVDGRTIEGSWDLTAAIRDNEGGDTVAIEYWRDGRVAQESVTLGTRETCTFDVSGFAESLEELHEVLPGLHMRGLAISEEAMEEVMESLRDIDWEEQLGHFEAIEMERLDVRMEELEARMEALGEHLGREGERIRIREVEVLGEAERAQIEREIEIRTELSRVRAEARRAAAEASRSDAASADVAARAAAARAEARAAAEAAAEARAEAAALVEEAARAAREEGGGSI